MSGVAAAGTGVDGCGRITSKVLSEGEVAGGTDDYTTKTLMENQSGSETTTGLGLLSNQQQLNQSTNQTLN